MLTPPVHSDELLVSFPTNHVLLLILNRPKSFNAMTPGMTEDLKLVLDWFDAEPELWVVIVTGSGKAFCSGQDLKTWHKNKASSIQNEADDLLTSLHGFGSISRRRTSSKPMIAAVNGYALGGGTELALNCDIVIASETAFFGLPEVKVGVIAAAGGIPRLAAVAGHQLASELLFTGRQITASEARDRFRFVNAVVPPEILMSTALEWASAIVSNSPDAVWSTKRALIVAKEHGIEHAMQSHALEENSKKLYSGDNIKEGLKAFAEKRKPIWKSPAKL